MKFYSFTIKAIIIIVCFLFHGCASYKQVKEMNVNDLVTIENVGANVLSACTWELMKEDSGQIYHHSYDPLKKKWFIVAEFRTLLGGGNGIYNFSVSFEDIANQNTLIEIRSLKTIWGNAEAPIELIFQQIKQCQDGLKHVGCGKRSAPHQSSSVGRVRRSFRRNPTTKGHPTHQIKAG